LTAKCKAIRKDSKPCQAEALAEGDVDVLKRGAPAELVNLLADTIDDVRTGTVVPQEANSAGYLAGVMTKILQYEAIEECLKKLWG